MSLVKTILMLPVVGTVDDVQRLLLPKVPTPDPHGNIIPGEPVTWVTITPAPAYWSVDTDHDSFSIFSPLRRQLPKGYVAPEFPLVAGHDHFIHELGL